MTDPRKSGQPLTTSDLSASALSTPHFPRHPPKWSDIRRYRRVLPESAYISLRHFETIVVINSRTGNKEHRILSLSEDRFYILKHKKYHQACPRPILLKDVIRVKLLEGKHKRIFGQKRLDQMTQHIKIVLNSKEDDLPLFIELYTWEKESKLLWHLKRAWYTFSVRFMQGLPISISMEGDERDVRRLYSEVEDEILECTIHGNISNSQDCGSLLAELSEALLQDRQVKSLFFDSGRLLRFLLKNLALLQANDPKIARECQLRLVIAMLTTLHAALFNSETLDRRLNMLVPVPHTFSGMIEILTLDYGKRAAANAASELQKQIKEINMRRTAERAKEHVEGLLEEKNSGTNPRLVIHDMLRSTVKIEEMFGTNVRSSGESTINYSPRGSPTRHMSTEDYYDDHATYDEQLREINFGRESGERQSISSQTKNNGHKNLMKGDLSAGLDLNTNTASISFAPDADSRSAHTHIANRVHRSNSMLHIWSHGGQNAVESNVPPTWSKAKNHGLKVNLIAKGAKSKYSSTSDNFDDAEHLGHALMMTASKWEHAKTKVAEKEALLFSSQYLHEEQFKEEILGKDYLEKVKYGEGLDSDDSEPEVESAYGQGRTSVVNIQVELLRKIELLQCLIMNEIELIVQHGVFHKSGHVLESFAETVVNIPKWKEKRLPVYVSRLRELITHRSEDRLPSSTFSWLVFEHVKFIHNLALGTYKLRESLKNFCDTDLKFYFCDDKFIKNLDPNMFLNSFSLRDLDEALIWIFHSEETAGDEKKMKQKQASNDIIKWEFSKLLMETGDADYVYGPRMILKRKTNRSRALFPIYYRGEPIIRDGVSGILTFGDVSIWN
eukprot:g15360.t1